VPADEPIPDHRVPNCFVRSMLLEMRDAGLSMQWVYRTAGVRAKFHGGIGGRCTSWEIYVRIKRVYDAFLDSDLPNLAGVEVGSGSTS